MNARFLQFNVVSRAGQPILFSVFDIRYSDTSIPVFDIDTFQNFAVRYAIFDTFLNNCAVGLTRNPLFKFCEKRKKRKKCIFILFHENLYEGL
jgi:hypothetical protein